MDGLIRGVVTITVVEARKLYNSEFMSGKGGAFVRVRLHPSVDKRTRVVPGSDGAPKWDETKHIPTLISPDEGFEMNYLNIDVFSVITSSDGSVVERKVGSLTFHVHDIIRKAPVSGWFGLHQESSASGELHVAFLFGYGAFGYGYSPQLLEESRSAESRAKFSLFPHAVPPQERLETDRATLVPRALPHPPFIPFDERITLGFGQKIKPIVESNAVPAEEFPALSTRLEQLGEMRETLKNERSRASRLAMLSDSVYLPHRTTQVYRETEREGDITEAMAYSPFVVPADRIEAFAEIRRGRTEGAMRGGVAEERLRAAEAGKGQDGNIGFLRRIERRLSWFQGSPGPNSPGSGDAGGK